MSRRWLLDIGIGPVGRFIAAGRRSRDLWWGSTWVSECARQTAKWLHEEGGAELLVPSWARVLEVEAAKSRIDSLTYSGRVSNRVRALVTASDTEEVQRLAEKAEEKARDILCRLIRQSVRLEDVDLDKLTPAARGRAASAKKRILAWLDQVLDKSAFQDQTEAILQSDDFLEFFAVWAPVESNEGFGPTFQRADELLTARKQARLFSVPGWSKPGRRKSDLDAGRDSVLISPPEPRFDPAYTARRRLGIGPDEGLDALGLARRIAALTHGPRLEPLPFPPLGRIAADPWIAAVAADEECRKAFEALKDLLEEERKKPEKSLFFSWCSPARDPEADRAEGQEVFPFDASILFEGGLEAEREGVRRLGKKGSAEEQNVQWALGALTQLEKPIRYLQGCHGMPPPYYALLLMDGDGVGQALGKVSSEQELRGCVDVLEKFADEAEKILRKHHGCAFYVGGDDLAAYLPADTAVGAASAVSKSFIKTVSPAFEKLGTGAMSLSGGIVLAHVKADLRAVRRLAKDALDEAKKARHGENSREAWLEVRDVPRSGVARPCRGPLGTLAGSLDEWRGLLAEDRLSLRSAQELLELAERFEDKRAADGGRLGLELAVARIVAQLRRSTKGASAALVERLRKLETWREVRQLAAELLVAKRILAARRLRPREPARETAGDSTGEAAS